MLPLYNSTFYHNYYPTDFETIDPEFGTKDDYFKLLDEAHKRGMKIYMDMEIQYVTEDHLWFKDSYLNPLSEYSVYMIYNGPGNSEPESVNWDLTELKSFDGTRKKVSTVNMNGEEVRRYHYDLFKYWVDPNRDGNFTDGVDGFRIDHMMDDLDQKGKITGLLTGFWKPLFSELNAINPDIQIIGEQGDWGSYGREYFEQGDLDMIFAFQSNKAIKSFDKQQIINKYDSTLKATPENKSQVIFIENHDMDRFASVSDHNMGKMKIGAAFNLLLKGVPSIYYGQEIGMSGNKGSFGGSDGNDIPVREAFEWYRTINGNGMALWYKGTGPWWDQTNLHDNDGISFEEQKTDPGSLWNFYRNLIQLRKSNPVISHGNFRFIDNNDDQVITFLRWDDNQNILVAMNLSDKIQEIAIHQEEFPHKTKSAKLLFGTVYRDLPDNQNGQIIVNLEPYGIRVWLMR